jgi:hypothetical protein
MSTRSNPQSTVSRYCTDLAREVTVEFSRAPEGKLQYLLAGSDKPWHDYMAHTKPGEVIEIDSSENPR